MRSSFFWVNILVMCVNLAFKSGALNPSARGIRDCWGPDCRRVEGEADLPEANAVKSSPLKREPAYDNGCWGTSSITMPPLTLGSARVHGHGLRKEGLPSSRFEQPCSTVRGGLHGLNSWNQSVSSTYARYTTSQPMPVQTKHDALAAPPTFQTCSEAWHGHIPSRKSQRTPNGDQRVLDHCEA